MRKVSWTGLLLLVSLGTTSLASEGLSGEAAFEKLKSLEGRWEGHVVSPDGPKGAIEYRITSGGKTVMEFVFPDSPHEMVTMYFLDGSELAARHYCTMGNQPEMKLDSEASSAGTLRFVFTGGTNLDPASDTHIHDGEIVFEGDRLESEWAVYENGSKSQSNRFFLRRASE